jgi:hypothetical protein
MFAAMRTLRVAGLFATAASLALVAQAGAAKLQSETAHQTATPILALAMDGPRVAYMTNDRRVVVWNVVTGATSIVKGDYPSKGRRFGAGYGQVAIAGKRVAVLTRFVTGNDQQTQERLYTAAVGGSARRLGSLTNHSTNPLDGEPDGGLSWGDWIAGVVGSGNVLAVSTWTTNNETVTSHERLRLITPTGLRTIAGGPAAIVAESADDGHIAVLRSTQAWPADDVRPATTAPTVGVYSARGALLGELGLPAGPNANIRIALSGHELVVLTETSPQAGSLTTTLSVYDWTTGDLVHTWPLALDASSPGGDQVMVYGKLAAVEGPGKLHLVDLTTGKDVVIAPSSGLGLPATIGPRGLVYVVDRFYPVRRAQGKLTFVPMAKLVADLS